MENALLVSQITKDMFDEFVLTFVDETKRSYRSTLNEFCRFTGKDFLEASAEDFKAYFKSLETAYYCGNTTPKTVYRKYSQLIGFGSFILAQGKNFGVENFCNHMANIKRPDVSIVVPPNSIPGLEELDAIYQAASEDIENYAIIALVNKCSLSAEQLCSLDIDDFICDTEQQKGIVFGGNRYVKLPPDILQILDDYVIYRDGIAKSSVKAFFVNTKGKPLTKRVLQNRVKDVMERAGEVLGREKPLPFSIQDIRNLSVVIMILGGAEPEQVAEYIGIKPQWMQRYSRAVEQFRVAACDFNFITIRGLGNIKT